MAALLLVVLSLFLPLGIVKENRVSAGTSIFFTASPYAVITLIISFILISIFIYRENNYIFITAAFLLFSVLFIFFRTIPPGYAAEAARPDLLRISPGAGFWILLTAAYILLQPVFPEKQRALIIFIPLLFISLFIFTPIIPYSSLYREFSGKKIRFVSEFFTHLRIAFGAVTGALIIGIPLGLLRKGKKGVSAAVNFLQTIPSLALFGLLMVPLSALAANSVFFKKLGIKGIGITPALIALTLYALLPIVSNTQTARESISKAVLEASRGQGLNKLQNFRLVELPLSIPLIINGIRIASVQAIGNTAIAALIGAGGLGHFIFRGIEENSVDLVLLGTIPIITLSILLDKLISFGVTMITPKGIR